MNLSIRMKLLLLLAGLTIFYMAVFWLLNETLLDDYYEYKKKIVLVDAYDQLNNYYQGDPQAIIYELQYLESIQGLHISIEDSGFNVKYSSSSKLDNNSQQNGSLTPPADIGNLAVGDKSSPDYQGNAPENSPGDNANPPGGKQPSAPGMNNSPVPIPGHDHPLPDLIRDNADLLSDQDEFITKTYEPEDGQATLHLAGKLGDSDYVLISLSMVSIEDNAAIASDFFMLAGLVILAAGLLITAYASGRFTRPIQELNRLAQSMAHLDFEQKFVTNGQDEISELGASLNSLSDQLKQSISDLQNANRQLQEDIDKERKLDQTRRDFIANVSHELKSPLALVQGYAEGLIDNVNSDEDRSYYCDVILDETVKMNTLVRQLLDLAQIESGGTEPEYTVFDIAEMVNGLIRKSDMQLSQKNLIAVLDGPDGLKVRADAFMTEQVLNNYLINAIHHVDEQSKIVLRWSVCAGNSKVRVSVINTGPPIQDDLLDDLWKSFYKVDAARSRDYGGSGLGLAIVKAIQEAQNNACGVLNHPGEVEFWMELDLEI